MHNTKLYLPKTYKSFFASIFLCVYSTCNNDKGNKQVLYVSIVVVMHTNLPFHCMLRHIARYDL